MSTKLNPGSPNRRVLQRAAVVAVSVVLLAVLLPPAAAQVAPSESDVEDARKQQGAQQSSLPVLPSIYFGIARFGEVRLVCPETAVEGDLVRCFVAEYTLVGKRFVSLALANLFRLPTPVVTASAASPTVPSELLAGRFESPGFAVESGGYWWVFVQTVDDDRCGPEPYSLNVGVTAGSFSLDATVSVLDDGDPAMPDGLASQCVPPARLEALDASAAESDDALVFTVRATDAAPQADVQVDYALSPGSAVAVSDYSDVSGTLTIPAGARHATISVPLVDDSAMEGVESLELVLSNPVGATLVDAVATGSIADDDADTLPVVPSPVAVCADAVLTGSVSDVFDVAQAGFAEVHHAFVDVDVACPGVGSPTGLPVGVAVVDGPRTSLGKSEHCLVQVGARAVTASAASDAGCETFAVARPVGGVDDGRSTHLVRVPDASVGQMHQLLVWVDADRDRAHGAGEPYQYVATDFVGRSTGGATLVDFALGAEFEVRLLDGVISRAGKWTTARVRLGEVVEPGFESEQVVVPARTLPLDRAPVGAFVSVGPSSTARVHCVAPPTGHAPSSGRADGCVTDGSGQVTFRWRTPGHAAHALRRGRDTVRVFIDRDRDGVYDPDPVDVLAARAGAEPSAVFDVDVAKAVNYVVLGDSYSSGEAGDLPPTGLYQTGVSPADAHCRRWSEAYPNVFARDVLGDDTLGIDVTFATYACTGAVTLNIHDPRSIGDGVTQDDLVGTNRPSRAVPSLQYDSSTGELLPHPTDWEPRQAMSLAAAQALADIDMITITIGGNDAGFGDVLKSCVTDAFDFDEVECRPGGLPSGFDEIPMRLAVLLAELKRVAPDASIFVLGYPHITPDPIEANRTLIDYCGLPGKPLHATGVTASPIAAVAHRLFGGTVADAAISYAEAQFLRDTATELNEALGSAASAAGVHFVDVTGESDVLPSNAGFVGHSPCSSEPWLNGFVRMSGLSPVSDRSFHPNRAGHVAYAAILETFVRELVESGAELSDSGLPVNPGASE